MRGCTRAMKWEPPAPASSPARASAHDLMCEMEVLQDAGGVALQESTGRRGVLLFCRAAFAGEPATPRALSAPARSRGKCQPTPKAADDEGGLPLKNSARLVPFVFPFCASKNKNKS